MSMEWDESRWHATQYTTESQINTQYTLSVRTEERKRWISSLCLLLEAYAKCLIISEATQI